MSATRVSRRAKSTLKRIADGPRGVYVWEPAVGSLPNKTTRMLIRLNLVEVVEDKSQHIAGVVMHVMLVLRVTDEGRRSIEAPTKTRRR